MQVRHHVCYTFFYVSNKVLVIIVQKVEDLCIDRKDPQEEAPPLLPLSQRGLVAIKLACSKPECQQSL